MNLTQQVKDRARQLGADLVGIAPVERFAGAPPRMSPRGLLPEARCVVVAGIHHLDAAVELAGVPTPHDIGPYQSQSTAMNPKLDDISFLLGRFLEDNGHRALPIAASNIWRYHGYKDLEVEFAPDLAHRYAAVAAGLGQIGWSGLTLTPEFGPRNRFVSVVTDADLDPSPMYDGEDLCDKCRQCVLTCPTDAFRKEVRGMNELEIGGKTFRFPQTSKWRCAWAENFCLSLDHDLPDNIDEPTILTYLEKYGLRGGELGCCLQFCMNPQRRYQDPSYCRPPRRRKDLIESDPDRLLAAVEGILDAAADVLAVGAKADFDGVAQVNPDLHLPDAASVICIGFRWPQECADNPEFLAVLRRRLDYAAFDVAHYLDIAGYSALSNTKIHDWPVAQALGVYQPDVRFTTVLTSAALPSVRRLRPAGPAALDGPRLRDFCRQAGADLVGFAGAGRFAELRDALEVARMPPGPAEVVEDAGQVYGPYVPQIRPRPATVKSPADWLAGAKSVIVLAVHLPHTSLDTAKVTPAETVGPFAFARYEAQRLAGDAALAVIRRLNDAGYRATLTHDLTGLGSKVHSSRGMLPDMRANRYAALLSGLAHIGIHGRPITAEYGTRQVFVAVVTDCPLDDDPLYEGPIDCHRCDRPCVAACPTAALGGDPVALTLASRSFALGRVDGFACDWATRYCLSAEAGPRFCGLDSDVPVPAERGASAVAAAVSKVNWGVQKRHANIAEECIRVCPARGRPQQPPLDERTDT